MDGGDLGGGGGGEGGRAVVTLALRICSSLSATMYLQQNAVSNGVPRRYRPT